MSSHPKRSVLLRLSPLPHCFGAPQTHKAAWMRMFFPSNVYFLIPVCRKIWKRHLTFKKGKINDL